MAKTKNFDLYIDVYEKWFEKNQLIYKDEIKTLKQLVGNSVNGLDIGMGSGRFALPLGIDIGIEPSKKMREISVAKGLHAIDGIAENLPFNDETFDFSIMINVICFVDDPFKALTEAYRVIRKNGFLIIGIIDKNSQLGKKYEASKNESHFYSNAIFYSTQEVILLAKKSGFFNCTCSGVEMTDQTDNSFVFIKCFK